MKESTKYIISAVILSSSLAGMAGLYSLKKKPESTESVDLLPTVATYSADAFDGKLGLTFSGIVVPYREISLAVEVSGLVEAKSEACRAGNFVKAGTLLITVEKDDYELEINRLKAELNQSSVMIDELADELAGLEQSIELAQEDYDIQLAEYKRRQAVKNALSVSEIEQARRNLKIAERGLTEVKNNLVLLKTRKLRLQSGMELSQIQLDKAQLNMKRTDIFAPFDGVIVMDMVEQGDFVQKGQQVVSLEDTSKAEVKCSLRLDQLEQILKYQSASANREQTAYELPATPVTVCSTAIGPKYCWSGTLVRYDGIGLDEQTKMIPCSVVVDHPVADGGLGPKALVRGMFVQIDLELDTVHSAESNPLLMFPEVAIHPGDFVWTVSDNRLQRHKIELVDRQRVAARESFSGKDYLRQMVIASVAGSGLKPGDLIVVTPLSQPIPGTEVKILEQYPSSSVAPDSSTKADADEAPRLSSNKKEGQS